MRRLRSSRWRWTACAVACATACASDPPSPPGASVRPSPTPSPSPVAEASENALARGVARLHLGARDLVVVTNRPDVDVRGVTLSVFVSDPSRSQIDGRAPSSTHHYVELAPGGGGTFRLPELDVVVESSVLACVSIKAWLAGLSNQIDGLYYSVLDDRYALVSYCTSATGPDYASAAPRFGQNRVDRFDAFETALGRPIVVRLNDRPLPAPSTELR